MNKVIVSSLVAVVALGANVASAQSYYPTYSYGSTYTQPYVGACVNLLSDLLYGSNGSQVRQLQTFLVSRNYPGGGSWMITGNYRTATLTAVRNFQTEQNLPVTGVVDAATRAAISRVTCGGSIGYNNYNYNTNPFTYSALPAYAYGNNYNYNNYGNSNCYNTYPYTCNTYNYGYGVSLSSISPVSGEPGTNITIYGTNLDYLNNTVYFGSQPVASVPSSNGSSLTVTIPGGVLPGGVGVYVTNSRGTSNTLTFTVIASYSACNYPYTYGTYNATSYCPPNVNAPYIAYLNPTSGAVGSMVTVYGSGFSPTGNTVHFGGGVITGLNSTDGRTLSFIVPSSLSGYSSQVVTIGSYNVSVSSFRGQTSNAVPFNVTSIGSYGAPTITSVNGPTSLTLGTLGTWTITVNNQGNAYMTTSVTWGDEGYLGLSAPQTTYAQGTNTLTFTHTYNAAGTYTVTFRVANSAGQQNTSSATVFVSGSGTYGNVSLSYLTPTSGRVGTQVMLQGTGFNALDNTVHFGQGGTLHVPSFNNGTTMYYTIPAYSSPCDTMPGTYCTLVAQQVTPGSYPLYVTNGQGTSQTLMFQVQ